MEFYEYFIFIPASASAFGFAQAITRGYQAERLPVSLLMPVVLDALTVENILCFA